VGKTTGYAKTFVPDNCQHITAFIDVHKRLLYYIVVAWEENFNGWIVDYGTWPEIGRRYFSLREIRGGLLSAYPGLGSEGAIYKGLKDLSGRLLDKKWGNGKLTIEKLLIDANWKTNLVKTFCKESTHGALILPTHGRYIGADRKPLNEYRQYPGDRSGVNWRIPSPLGRGTSRHVIFDVNYWKSFINTAFLTPAGERGCLQLFKGEHKLFADHCTTDYFTEVSARGKTVMQWNPKPGNDDNHWWDCIVGAAVGAAILGCRTIDASAPKRSKMRIRYI